MILDDAQVAWLLKEHRDATRRITDAETRAAAERDAIDIALIAMTAADRVVVASRTEQLVAHADALRAATGAKSQRWPSATIRSTTRTNLAYTDEQAIAETLAGIDDQYVRRSIAIAKTVVAKAVRFVDGAALIDGELVPGITETTTTTWTITHGQPSTETEAAA